VIVREVARELPDHVAGVLFGSPIIGGPMHTIAARAFDPAAAALATAALEALDAERPVRVPLTSILGVDLSADQAGDSPAARGSPGGETNRRTPLRTPDLLDDVEVVERRLAVQEAGPPLVCGFRLRQFGDLGGVVLGGELQQLPEVIGAVVIGSTTAIRRVR